MIALAFFATILAGYLTDSLIGTRFIAIIRIPGKSLWAAITQDFAVVFGGRQPAGVVRLALQKSFSKCNLHFLTWWTAKSVMKSSKACCIATKTG